MVFYPFSHWLIICIDKGSVAIEIMHWNIPNFQPFYYFIDVYFTTISTHLSFSYHNSLDHMFHQLANNIVPAQMCIEGLVASIQTQLCWGMCKMDHSTLPGLPKHARESKSAQDTWYKGHKMDIHCPCRFTVWSQSLWLYTPCGPHSNLNLWITATIRLGS